jgi:formate dehydrogenase subunit gamma
MELVMLNAVYVRWDISTGYSLFTNFQASAVANEWHNVIVLLAMVAGGMTLLGLVTNYLIVHNIRPIGDLQYDKNGAKADVVRYRKPARILHWVCAAAFTILFVTGISRFVSSQGQVASGSWLYIFHIVAGIVFVAAPVIYFLTNRRASLKGIKYALIWGKEDLDWMKAAPYYYFLCDERAMPPQGYLNTLQKVWLLLVVVFGMMLAVSGVIMWAFMDIASADLLQYILFVHDIAFIAIGTMFLVHVYISVLHPMSGSMETGAWSAITRGKVSVEYIRSHHQKWYQELSKAQKTDGNKNVSK